MTDETELKEIEAQAARLLESYDCPEIAKATAADIPRLIKAIRERDKRIAELEEELEDAHFAAMGEDL